jgi:hypothetical protein
MTWYAENITQILQSHHYSISPDIQNDFTSGMEEELKNYNMTVEGGLHIFSPTADVLHDFDNFLLKVEDIAGRERGVVKVILPKEL